MGQILHPSAGTTPSTRRKIQNSKESITQLAKKYGIARNTVWKWKKRNFVHDAPRGINRRHSTVLSREEEALIVAFRKHTLLPLDDCLYSLKKIIPRLNRSNIYRCLKRHGIQRLPKSTNHPRTSKKKFKKYPIGYFHIDITEIRTKEGKQQMYVAIDRTCKFAYAQLYNRKTSQTAIEFLKELIDIVPYKIHTILTDNGGQFTYLKTNKKHTNKKKTPHVFDKLCQKERIRHRLTRPYHPWTNGQVERMNRTIKEATVYRYYYASSEKLKQHLQAFLNAYNFAKQLRTLQGLTPYEFIQNYWTHHPEKFKINPSHLNMKPYTYWGRNGKTHFKIAFSV